MQWFVRWLLWETRKKRLSMEGAGIIAIRQHTRTKELVQSSERILRSENMISCCWWHQNSRSYGFKRCTFLLCPTQLSWMRGKHKRVLSHRRNEAQPKVPLHVAVTTWGTNISFTSVVVLSPGCQRGSVKIWWNLDKCPFNIACGVGFTTMSGKFVKHLDVTMTTHEFTL